MIKNVLKSICSFAVAFLIVNAICFFYYNPLHETELNNYRVEPNTVGVYALEGFAILSSDKNGFSNRDDELVEKDYILVMGSSQSTGEQVLRENRYSDILDKVYSQDGKIHVYNVAHSGKRFWHIIKNFKDIITEFPDSKAVIIEISDGTATMSEQEFQNAMEQIEYEDSIHGEELQNHMLTGKVAMGIKKSCPFVLLMYRQLTRKSFTEIGDAFLHMNSTNRYAENSEGIASDEEDDLYNYYVQSLSLIRSEYSGKIIVIYHEPLTTDELINKKYEESKQVTLIEAACAENDIIFIDMGQSFLQAYVEDNRLPYGFHNTEFGNGHLNKAGHRIIAERLLTGLQVGD